MVTQTAVPLAPELTLARAARGEAVALETLYRELRGPLFALLARLCRTREDAEDLLHDSFLVIAKELRGYRGEGSFSGWAKRIAVRQALMFYRKRGAIPKHAPLPGDDEDGPAPAAGGPSPATLAAARADLETLLARLGETDRMMLWLHEVEGWTHDELGALFGFSASGSKSRLSRAHQKLREWLP